MDPIISALQAEQDELAAMVDPLDAEQLALPSRCAGWTIADVLLHLAQTNEMAVASVLGDLPTAAASLADTGAVSSVDEWAAVAVETQRSGDLSDIRNRWLSSAEAQLAVFADCDPQDRVQWVVGEMAARTLATTRLSETWIHSGDVAAGLGAHLPATERLWHIARLVQRTLPYAFSTGGYSPTESVRFVLHSPSGEVWVFGDSDARSEINGTAHELCVVAGQRLDPSDSGLVATGPDGAAALELMRTFA